MDVVPQGLADEAISAIRSKVNGALSSKKSRDSSSDSSKGTGKDVVQLNDDNFASLVYGSSDYWLVEFYANGCGYCERLKPEYAEAASILKSKVRIFLIYVGCLLECECEKKTGRPGR